MSGQTIGAFLKEKMHNMAKWIAAELEMPEPVARTELEACTAAGMLAEHNAIVAQRNWAALLTLLQTQGALRELHDVIIEVQRRKPMHDKFWRYMDLFVETVSE